MIRENCIDRSMRTPVEKSQAKRGSFSFENQTVMLAPATGFYGTKGLGKNEVRLAYVLNVRDLNKAMDCLERALQDYPGRTEVYSAETADSKII